MSHTVTIYNDKQQTNLGRGKTQVMRHTNRGQAMRTRAW